MVSNGNLLHAIGKFLVIAPDRTVIFQDNAIFSRYLRYIVDAWEEYLAIEGGIIQSRQFVVLLEQVGRCNRLVPRANGSEFIALCRDDLSIQFDGIPRFQRAVRQNRGGVIKGHVLVADNTGPLGISRIGSGKQANTHDQCQHQG